jgi:hypothetical protein
MGDASVPDAVASSEARRFRVSIEADGRVYVGLLRVPDDQKRVSELLTDSRPFLDLTDVSVDGAGELEPFVALSKRYVRTVRIIGEATARR